MCPGRVVLNILLSLHAGGNVNNNNFPSPNAKKFRPTFEGESGPSQDERYSPSPRTEASKPTSPNWRPQQQQQQQPPRRPKREESSPEKDTRFAN